MEKCNLIFTQSLLYMYVHPNTSYLKKWPIKLQPTRVPGAESNLLVKNAPFQSLNFIFKKNMHV